jgi:hypothetical protein
MQVGRETHERWQVPDSLERCLNAASRIAHGGTLRRQSLVYMSERGLRHLFIPWQDNLTGLVVVFCTCIEFYNEHFR